MAFFKFRQRGQAPSAPEPQGRRRSDDAGAGPQESIDTLRRRARHRLIGAAVLVALAVVAFPLLFDTQPRPVAIDAPITIPDKNDTAPLRVPPAPDNSPYVDANSSLDEREEFVTATAPPERQEPPTDTRSRQAEQAAARAKQEEAAAARAKESEAAAARSKREEEAKAARAKREEEAKARAKREEEARARAKREEATRAKQDEAAAARSKQEEAAAARAKREEEAKARAKREEEAKARAKREEEAKARAKREAEARAKREEAARARALLEGKGGSNANNTAAANKAPADSGRFIVQIGAFADDAAVRETRQKAERAGLKTYTQVVQTASGPRTRVRVGPFNSRADAEKAAATLKKAGLGGSILSL